MRIRQYFEGAKDEKISELESEVQRLTRLLAMKQKEGEPYQVNEDTPVKTRKLTKKNLLQLR